MVYTWAHGAKKSKTRQAIVSDFYHTALHLGLLSLTSVHEMTLPFLRWPGQWKRQTSIQTSQPSTSKENHCLFHYTDFFTISNQFYLNVTLFYPLLHQNLTSVIYTKGCLEHFLNHIYTWHSNSKQWDLGWDMVTSLRVSRRFWTCWVNCPPRGILKWWHKT